MRLDILIDLKAETDTGLEFNADACKSIRIDRTATQNEIYSQIIGALSPMIDKAASDFVKQRGLLKNG
jgi:hypothetical protein